MRSRGFTLIELLVVIAIIAILASILFPVFAKAREKARQTTCLSQVRQMATALQMFAQDNNGRYPGLGWAQAMADQGVSQKMFFCPSDSADPADNPVSYGYSGLLLKVDTNGVAEASVIAPTEVGAFIDAGPAKAFPNGGLIYGGALQDPATTAMTPAPRHSKGVVIGYCDGHAKFAGVPTLDDKDLSNPVTRAFILANPLGLVDNPAGGMSFFTAGANTTAVTIGGDACTAPILTAAAQAWKQQYKAAWYTRGFLGQYATAGRPAAYVWGCGDNNVTGSVIAKDAMVVVVAKNSKIPPLYLGTLVNATYNISTSSLVTLFGMGYSANTVQAYTYDTNSGSRAFFKAYLDSVGATVGSEFNSACVLANNDADMVDKVANDPYGIGYCSAAFADIDRVMIVGIGGKYFPTANPKVRWTVPSAAPDTATWPLMRSLYITWGGTAYTGAGNFINVMLAPAGEGFAQLTAGPLYKASFFLP